jgi:heme exporter protein B
MLTRSPLSSLLRRETRVALRQQADIAVGICFALLVIALFPFALSPEPALLQKLAAGLLLVAVLLAQFLSLEKTFLADMENGALDEIILSPVPLPLYVILKAFVVWLSHGLPLLVISPLLLLLLHVDGAMMPDMLLAVFFSTALLTLLGTGGAAITLGARNAGMVLPLILIPFAIPVLIFAVSLAHNGLGTAEGTQSFFFLAALFFLYLALLPFLAGAALKNAAEHT